MKSNKLEDIIAQMKTSRVEPGLEIPRAPSISKKPTPLKELTEERSEKLNKMADCILQRIEDVKKNIRLEK